MRRPSKTNSTGEGEAAVSASGSNRGHRGVGRGGPCARWLPLSPRIRLYYQNGIWKFSSSLLLPLPLLSESELSFELPLSELLLELLRRRRAPGMVEVGVGEL
jgi:hypothetical protein